MPAAPDGAAGILFIIGSSAMPELSVAEIAEAVNGRVEGGGTVRISGVAPLETAGPTELSFVANPRYRGYLQRTRAGAVLLPAELDGTAPEGVAGIVVEDPHIALYRALQLLHPPIRGEAGVHPTAVVDGTATVGEGVSIGPFAVVGPRSRIGAECRIGAQTVIGGDCDIGEGSLLHPHVTLYDGVRMGARCVIHSGARLGRDGFGFVWVDGGHRKVPQIGGCVLGDDVEVGANANIDRGSIADTVVGSGAKVDSMVHLGHNVRVGRHVIVVAQVGVSGSTSIGDGAVLGGQAGIGGHLTIGAGARIGAQAGVTASVPEGATYSGYPARPHRESLRAQGGLARLPQLIARVRELERAIFGGEDRDGNERSEREDD
jgi:UDP-3-O-[3-hydroxymyristoyl] glucosamine N-acyltransferase